MTTMAMKVDMALSSLADDAVDRVIDPRLDCVHNALLKSPAGLRDASGMRLVGGGADDIHPLAQCEIFGLDDEFGPVASG